MDILNDRGLARVHHPRTVGICDPMDNQDSKCCMYDTKTVHMVKHIYTQQMTNSTCRTQITDHGGGLSVFIHIQQVTLKLAPITHGCLSQKEEM